MPHPTLLLIVVSVPFVCLALLLLLDRLEETLDRSVDRRREQAAAPQLQLEASLAASASSRPAVAPADVSLGGSTNR
jgi:hypothetical protein